MNKDTQNSNQDNELKKAAKQWVNLVMMLIRIKQREKAAKLEIPIKK